MWCRRPHKKSRWQDTASRMLDSFSSRQHSPFKLIIEDRKSTRLNSSHLVISYAVFCLKKKKKTKIIITYTVHNFLVSVIFIILNYNKIYTYVICVIYDYICTDLYIVTTVQHTLMTRF